MTRRKKSTSQAQKHVESLTHDNASRKLIPTAEYRAVLDEAERDPIEVAYERRSPDLDPQLIWRGKDLLDWSDLVVQAPPLYIQEKVHPKVLIDDLMRESRSGQARQASPDQVDLFSDFNGVPTGDSKTEFYQHDANWSNRIILGDSLQVMASLAEREGLSGQIQCIYIDPPYGINFRSNFQWSTTTRDVKEGIEHITREPEQVKAFRDTWRHGIHSYLTYLRDRLTVSRELLTETGSVFVQIGEENVHRVRVLMDEVFGAGHFVGLISFGKNSGFGANLLPISDDYIVWYAKDRERIKYHQLFLKKTATRGGTGLTKVLSADGQLRTATKQERNKPETIDDGELVGVGDLTKPGPGSRYEVLVQGGLYRAEPRWWGTPELGMQRLVKTGTGNSVGERPRYREKVKRQPCFPNFKRMDGHSGAESIRGAEGLRRSNCNSGCPAVVFS